MCERIVYCDVKEEQSANVNTCRKTHALEPQWKGAIDRDLRQEIKQCNFNINVSKKNELVKQWLQNSKEIQTRVEKLILLQSQHSNITILTHANFKAHQVPQKLSSNRGWI